MWPQIAGTLAALIPVITALAALEVQHRGRAKELVQDRKEAEARADAMQVRAEAAETTSFRRLTLIQRCVVRLIARDVPADPVMDAIRVLMEKETT